MAKLMLIEWEILFLLWREMGSEYLQCSKYHFQLKQMF